MCSSKSIKPSVIMLIVDLSQWRGEGHGNCCWFDTQLTDLVKITNQTMLKHKSNLIGHVFTDQQCKFTTKCLYNIKLKNATGL